VIRMGGGNRRSLRRRNYLPYQLVRQFQRDLIVGLAMIVSCGILLLILGAATEPFTVELIDEGPQYVAQMSDGTICQIYETRPLDDFEADVRAMVDCGDRPGIGVLGVFQHLFLAIIGVGVVLVVSGGFALVVATRMSREMLVVPIGILGIVGGIVAVNWGLSGDSPGLVFQGMRDQATTGVLRAGGALTNRDGAVAWGVGLIAASVSRLTRP
jgi:hypothetical protein